MPTALARDGRTPTHGHSGRPVSHRWSGHRVRNLLASPVYKGIAPYGVRSKRPREVIERQVPALVDEATWAAAQARLRENFLYAHRNGKREYLLRGLMKCGLCGLTYTGGKSRKGKDGQVHWYYMCGGTNPGRGAYGATGQACPSRALPQTVEDEVWADVEELLRHPDTALAGFAAELQRDAAEGERLRAEIQRLGAAAAAKTAERDRVITLYRRGMIGDADVDRQLAELGREEAAVRQERDRLQGQLAAAEAAQATLHSAEAALRELGQRLEGPLAFADRRRLIELLVDRITVDTVQRDGRKEAVVTVTYRFQRNYSMSGSGCSG